MSNPRCARCRFWDARDADEEEYGGMEPDGLCRRRAPADHCRWPVTGAGDWCGEWKARKPDE